MRDRLQDFAGRRDVVIDDGGRVYCWPCLEKTGARAEGFLVTGKRLGNEPCAGCGRVGTIVLEVEAE